MSSSCRHNYTSRCCVRIGEAKQRAMYYHAWLLNCLSACLSVCMHACACIDAFMHVLMYVCMYVCMYGFMYVCICMYVCVYVVSYRLLARDRLGAQDAESSSYRWSSMSAVSKFPHSYHNNYYCCCCYYY